MLVDLPDKLGPFCTFIHDALPVYFNGSSLVGFTTGPALTVAQEPVGLS